MSHARLSCSWFESLQVQGELNRRGESAETKIDLPLRAESTWITAPFSTSPRFNTRSRWFTGTLQTDASDSKPFLVRYDESYKNGAGWRLESRTDWQNLLASDNRRTSQRSDRPQVGEPFRNHPFFPKSADKVSGLIFMAFSVTNERADRKCNQRRDDEPNGL